MSKDETTYNRVSDYSLFHRELGSGYYAIDVDWVEYRAGRGIVALICVTGNIEDKFRIHDIKKIVWGRTEFERKVINMIADKLEVPAYYVVHDTALTVFHVHNIKNLKEFKVMTEEDYKKFIKNL